MYFFPGDLTITFGITVRLTIPFIWRRLSVIANLRYHFSNCQWCGKFWRANHSEFLLRIDDQNFDKCHIPIPRNSTPTHLQHTKLPLQSWSLRSAYSPSSSCSLTWSPPASPPLHHHHNNLDLPRRCQSKVGASSCRQSELQVVERTGGFERLFNWIIEGLRVLDD